jgi:hypothetical protein
MKALRKALPLAAALVAALFAQNAAAACYVVYSPNQEIIYRAAEPPVDMSRQIHETLPFVAPGATMVFSSDNTGCEITINKLPLMASQGASTAMPMARAARADRG